MLNTLSCLSSKFNLVVSRAVLSLGIRKSCLETGGHMRMSSASGLSPYNITTSLMGFLDHLLSYCTMEKDGPDSQRVHLASSAVTCHHTELDCSLPPFCGFKGDSSRDYASNVYFVWQDEWELEKRKMPATYNTDGPSAARSSVLQICWQEIQRMTSS